MSQFPRAFAFLLLVSISSRFVFGEVSNPTHQAILFCLTLFLFAMTIEKQVFTHARSRNPVIGAFTIWVIFFFLPPQVEVFRLLCLVLLSFLLGKSSQDRNPQVATLFWALGISTLFLAGLIWLYQIEPLLLQGPPEHS